MSEQNLSDNADIVTVEDTIVENVELVVDDVAVNLEVTSSTTKAGVETTKDGVIASPERKKGKPAPSIAVVNGAIGSPGASRKDPVKEVVEPKTKKETVALFSTKNVFWENVGEVKRGYNFVTPAQAEYWKKRTHIRLATPKEIKEAFDN
jgi:hypothetical protein